ncbi:hypothetical protein, partial [Vibrio cholerae]
IFYVPSALFFGYSDLGAPFIVFIVVQSLLLFLFSLFVYEKAAKVFNGRGKGVSNLDAEPGFLLQLFSLFSVLFLLLYLFYSVFGNFDFTQLITHNARFYAKSKIGTAWVYFVIQFFIYILIYDVYKRKPTKLRLFLTVLAIMLTGLPGGRSTLILWLVSLIWICITVHAFRVNRFYMIVSALFFLLVFSGNAVLRSGSIGNVGGYFTSDAFRHDFNSSYILQDSIDYVHDNDDYYGVALQDFLYAFLPRKIYPEKPVSTAETRLVYSDFLSDDRTTNITFGMYGNLVINLGYMGLFISPIIVAFFTFKYFSVFSSLVRGENTVMNFYWFYFFLMYMICLRGGVINVRLVLMFIVLTFSVFTYEFFKRAKFSIKK